MLQIYVNSDKIMAAGNDLEVLELLEKIKEELEIEVVYIGRCG